MKLKTMAIGALAPIAFANVALAVEPSSTVFWGFSAEELEFRFTDDGEEAFAWDADALIGTDELKFVWRSEAEYGFEESAFEVLENQLRLQTPISFFFDAVAGVRFDTPEEYERIDAVLGLHGLAQQWFEIDLDLFIGEDPSLRFEAEYEALLTNYWILTPSLEIDLPFTDDEDRGFGAFAPALEAGLRLSYDLYDRTFSPYLGIHYETSFGETADIAREDSGERDSFSFVLGARIFF